MKNETEKIIRQWFKEFMVDKRIRTDVMGITCLEELIKRLNNEKTNGK